MTYQILTCPNCGGSGRSADGRSCPICQGTGKVRISPEQLQKLKSLSRQLQLASNQTFANPVGSPQTASNPNTTNLAGIIAFSILSLLVGGAAASWYFLKSFKPFFSALTAVIALIGFRFSLKQRFFQLSEPDDFLKAIKKPNPD